MYKTCDNGITKHLVISSSITLAFTCLAVSFHDKGQPRKVLCTLKTKKYYFMFLKENRLGISYTKSDWQREWWTFYDQQQSIDKKDRI